MFNQSLNFLFPLTEKQAFILKDLSERFDLDFRFLEGNFEDVYFQLVKQVLELFAEINEKSSNKQKLSEIYSLFENAVFDLKYFISSSKNLPIFHIFINFLNFADKENLENFILK